MIKCIIVEDELLAQQVIQSHLKNTNQLELVAVCNNAIEAKDALSKNEVDLIFLDIQLPGMTGLNFLRTVQDPPLIVLTTAYTEYALESYDFNVIDYLLKPISLDRFNKAISKITSGRVFPKLTNTKDDSPDHLFIKSGSKFFKVNLSDIIYIQSMKDYLKIYTKDHKLITHQTMGDMEKILPSKQFIRVHKSYMVAIASIKIIYGNTVELEQAVIPIGNIYKNNVMNLVARKN